MDTSEQYIKMCEQADRAGLHKIGIGQNEHWYCSKHRCFLTVTDHLRGLAWLSCPKAKWSGDREHYRPDCNGESFCVYAQDDLQAMVSSNYWELRSYPPGRRLDEGLGFEFNLYSDGVIEVGGASPEQALLKGVMKGEYNKTWNGTEWVKG